MQPVMINFRLEEVLLALPEKMETSLRLSCRLAPATLAFNLTVTKHDHISLYQPVVQRSFMFASPLQHAGKNAGQARDSRVFQNT